MAYNRIFAILIVALMIIGLSCAKKETGIIGKLILQTGQQGDVRNSRVRLFIQQDLTGNPVEEVASDSTGVDKTTSEFEFTDVSPNHYYLLAWKDLNNSGEVDNLDIVGVYGGTYGPGYGGSQLQVTEGEMTDVGNIVMYIYKELTLTTSHEKTAEGWLAFFYEFNDACYVSNWSFTLPGGSIYYDQDQIGNKSANTKYRSPVENQVYWAADTLGSPMPTGNYIITISGNYSVYNFTLVDTLTVAK